MISPRDRAMFAALRDSSASSAEVCVPIAPSGTPSMRIIHVTDGILIETARTRQEAARVIQSWFDYLVDTGEVERLPVVSSWCGPAEHLQDYANRVCSAVSYALADRRVRLCVEEQMAFAR